MPLHFRTVRLGSPREPGEGLRFGTVRWLPRGVRKTDYARLDWFDAWLPVLAPSRDLLRSYRDGKLEIDEFFQHYRKEMAEPEPQQVIASLARLAQHTPLSVGCYCEDETRCHRSQLGALIRQAAATPGTASLGSP
jgi:uncharacterized protein YeaO (DUF488 family)